MEVLAIEIFPIAEVQIFEINNLRLLLGVSINKIAHRRSPHKRSQANKVPAHLIAQHIPHNNANYFFCIVTMRKPSMNETSISIDIKW